MVKFLKVAIIGLLSGFVGAEVSVPLANAACELGCQESFDWVIKKDVDPDACLLFDKEQGHDGQVAGDIGSFTQTEDEIDATECPLSDCNINCPSGYNVPHQAAANGAHQGCNPNPLTVTRFFCYNP